MNTERANSSILHLIEPGMMVCEIGVADGQGSEAFLEKGCFLYMIDPWKDYEEYTDSYDFNICYEEAQKVAEKYKTNCKIIKKKSDDAIDDVPNYLGLVYIDGNHAKEFVKRDIYNYWTKVKQGGWLIGDDFSMNEVKEAVFEFLIEQNNPKIQLSIYGRNWVIQKV